MFTRVLATPDARVRLVAPVVARDSALSVRWLNGTQGRDTLRMMGVPEREIRPPSLDEETDRVAGFIGRTDQYNWMIEFGGRIVGAIWVDLEPSAMLAAPAVSYMIGDPSARGHGVAGAALAAVLDFMSGQGCPALYARALVTNAASARVLLRAGFADVGDPYLEHGNGLIWRTFVMRDLAMRATGSRDDDRLRGGRT